MEVSMFSKLMMRKNLREEIHPRESAIFGAFLDLGLLLVIRDGHHVEFLASLGKRKVSNSLPDFEGFQSLLLVHEKPGTLRQKEHTGKEKVRWRWITRGSKEAYPKNMMVEKTRDDPRIYLQLPGTRRNMAATAYPRTSPRAILNWYKETKLPRILCSTVSAT